MVIIADRDGEEGCKKKKKLHSLETFLLCASRKHADRE